MTDVTDLQNQIDQVRANPAAMQRIILQYLDDAMDGTLQIVDPTNPFVFLNESNAVVASAAMVRNDTNNRKQYPSMALTYDDLYLHMSDTDYMNRFATPTQTVFKLALAKDELISRMVPTGVGSVSKVTIPRNTQFTVAGVSFTMQYPIDIKLMAHGGLTVVYDTSELSPLQTLASNIVQWTTENYGGRLFVVLQIPVYQFAIQSEIGKYNTSSNFSRTYTFADQFYYARAYYAAADGSWVEMRTTHTDQVFDPLSPTAVLKVVDGQVTVSIPQVYMTNALVGSEMRLDIYTTKGPLNMIMSNYIANNFSLMWKDYDNDPTESTYWAPLTQFQTMFVYSDSIVAGGTNGLTFAQLRDQVMTNSEGPPSVPITNVQLTSRLQDLGYNPVANVDNITNRQFLATRALPAPTDGSVIAGAACAIETLQASMTDLVTFSTVADNGDRITILPTTLFQDVGGVISVVPDATVANLNAMAVDARARTINGAGYIYTPFHYVLDMNNDTFDLRAYYLDNPLITTKTFVDENDSTGLEVGTDSYSISRTSTGYLITLTTDSSTAFQQLDDSTVFAQLSFVPTGEQDRAYLNGTLIGKTQAGERVYQFALNTNYDVDSNDNIVLTTFQMYADPARNHSAALTQDFYITYAVSGISATVGLVSSEIDLTLGKTNLPDDVVGVAEETLNTQLGSALHGLWTASRSVAGSQDYQRYTADVPAVYSMDVFARDPVTGFPETTVVDGNIELVYLHHKGDPILDTNGQPTYLYRIGDVMVDAQGNPIVVSSRNMQRQVDLFMLDGIYWFANETTAVNYKTSIPNTIVGWLSGDIASISSVLLEQTSLFFFPQETLGQVAVVLGEDTSTTINAQQTFFVTFYLSSVAYRDADLRASLTSSTVATINTALQSMTVTKKDITSALDQVVGSDVIAYDISGLGGTTPDQPLITLVQGEQQLSIGKQAVAKADGTLGVQDAVNITFLLHGANS